ncbi:MAG TPA: DUF255 domain-containing protein, partial [Nannocystis exedens]|nr:DUF255 domain-containing protein [Nannocystis exedens]
MVSFHAARNARYSFAGGSLWESCPNVREGTLGARWSPLNRLATSTSPYLRQHADNPVDWYPWSEEALARARDL